jgi:YidC/Oxa1 family membrane protein insertase
MKESMRYLLVILLFVAFYMTWHVVGVKTGLTKMVPVEESPLQSASSEGLGSAFDDTPSPETEAFSSQESATLEAPAEASIEADIPLEFVLLENEHIQFTLSNEGAVMTSAVLKNYYDDLAHREHVRLIQPFEEHPGALFMKGLDVQGVPYHIENKDETSVTFFREFPSGYVRKTYTLGHSFDLTLDIATNLESPYRLTLSDGLQPQHQRISAPGLFSGGAISPKLTEVIWMSQEEVETKAIDKIKGLQFTPMLKEESPVTWLGIKDTYFCNTFQPSRGVSQFLGRQTQFPLPGEDPLLQGALAIEGQGPLTGTFYIGPLERDMITSVNPQLKGLIKYGWAGQLSRWLLLALEWIHGWIGNWGWAIVIMTFFIRLVLFPLTAPAIKSGYKMREIQPQLEALKKKFSGTDMESKQKLSQETFKLYKKEGVNPFSSCITILPQLPIFFAYFSLLRTAISLRHSPWIFWIEDLSAKDPTYILPIFWGISMYISQMLTPMPGDPNQQKIMKFMPVAMTFFFLGMPSGLVLYMITSNLFQLLQTVVMKWRYQP